MYIKKIDTFPLLYRLPRRYGDANGMKSYRTCFLIRITTDSGIEGWGECVDWLPTLQKGFHERIIPFLLGKPIADRAKILQTIIQWNARSAAALSMALTEIMAKKSGISVCDMWGGRFRDKVPVYASFQSYSEDLNWQKNSLALIGQAIHAGFDKIKIKIGGKTIAEDQQHINSVQALLESKIDLALDANQSYDLAAALRWKSLLEAWPNLLWLEEPLKVDYIGEYARLRSRLNIPLAGGENIEKAAKFIPFLTGHALDFITPDPMHAAGLDGFREAGRLARCFGIRITPHTYDGALARLYALFAQACLEPWSKMEADGIEPVEWDVMDNPFTKLLPLSPAAGTIYLPSGNGIGVEPDADMLAYYQWDGSSY
ncbi:mandelate racemase/muconate lactonizing enzyme family protein [Paenibacillus sp. GCM10027626]|uniref:mandelate racemase/muconate lactonizing enzyme family protein n=1 Tax=Paenibacillus sp. GCM10027626 TaxID=3273411 RepID=UPI0036273049